MPMHGSGWTVLALGVWHGLNPAMGWLFAVALGLQQRRARAVWRALLPLAAGHALAIAAVVAVAAAAGLVVSLAALRWVTALILVGTGLYRLGGHGHGRYVGMQVGSGTLALWSLLMASAHGAGLMVVPFVLGGLTGTASPHDGHAMHMAATLPIPGAEAALAVTAIHTAGYLITVGVIAVVVYHKLGLRMLQRMWLNLDRVWATALILTGVATLLVT